MTLLVLWVVVLALALSLFGPRPAFAGSDETVGQALCRLVETSAKAHSLPIPFLTRLIWQESSFRTTAVSRAGAQGVAQFMPRTAQARALADPFDPEQAIPAAAHFLSDLRLQFGNLGLAAAAYNGGPNRVAAWLVGKASLPAETRDYVTRITGHSAEEWKTLTDRNQTFEEPQQSCILLTANLRRLRGQRFEFAAEPLAPWGVQLAGNFSKKIALASFDRVRQAYRSILGDLRPMVIGTRMRSRGLRAFYRVRLPAASRETATALCNRLQAVGGSCVVLRT